jgi:GR25 family glycosyltransferase involved in LPS biosynthesis
MKIDKIYYINLDKREDRKEFMEDQLSDINIPYERFSAIRPTEADLDSKYKTFHNRLANKKYRSKSQLLGTFGCYMSHYLVQKKANESSHGDYLVLEDDWRVKPESLEALESVFDRGLVSGDWDIFGSFWASHEKIVIKHQGSNGKSRFFNNRNGQPMGGTHFMLFNKRSTSKIINFLDAENVFNIDAVLCNDMLNIYHMKMPITNNNFDSDIQI